MNNLKEAGLKELQAAQTPVTSHRVKIFIIELGKCEEFKALTTHEKDSIKVRNMAISGGGHAVVEWSTCKQNRIKIPQGSTILEKPAGWGQRQVGTAPVISLWPDAIVLWAGIGPKYNNPIKLHTSANVRCRSVFVASAKIKLQLQHTPLSSQ